MVFAKFDFFTLCNTEMKTQDWCNKKYVIYLNKIWKTWEKWILMDIYKMKLIHYQNYRTVVR